jgi:hypothetical protein
MTGDGSNPETDPALEAELRDAAAFFDPVPPALREAAVEAFDLRSIDAELARLVFDSLVEASAVRGGGESRLLTFQTGERAVDVELINAGTDRRLVGQLRPAGPAQVELRSPHRSALLVADEWGRFTTLVTSGPFSLRCRWSGPPGRDLVTEWISV